MNKLPNVINLMILTLVTLLIWLSFTVIRSFTAEPAAIVPVEIVLPINPNLDSQTLDQMETKL
jgi:hypothetical protein